MLKKLCFALSLVCVCFNAYSEDFYDDFFDEEEVVVQEKPQKTADEMSVDALNNYEVEGSLFEQITTLEQEKLIMQLEAERTKLDIELDRLNKEKMKLQMEIDEISGNAQDKQQELTTIRKELEAQTEKLQKQVEELQKQQQENSKQEVAAKQYDDNVEQEDSSQLSNKYKLINVIGVGNQLQATIEDVASGQNKRISVGKQLNGYTVKSISLNDGIVFEKDGVSEILNVGR